MAQKRESENEKSTSFPHADEYLTDQWASGHLSPRLIVEKALAPSFTVWVSSDGEQFKIQRWYDVTPEVLNRVASRSVDFIADSVVRLLDKEGNEIHKVSAKLTDEFDGLAFLLARIEKAWSHSKTAEAFWKIACSIMLNAKVPGFKEPVPDFHVVTRVGWIELCCFWIAFLAQLRHRATPSDWDSLLSGDNLIQRYIDFYNDSPMRGPELREPSYQADRVQLQMLLDAVRVAKTNKQKKQSLEALSERVLSGVAGFQILPNKVSATGEIDRVIRNDSTYPTLARLKSPILVECKHWQKTVGTDPMAAFIVDLQDAKLNSGFLFSRKAISRPARRRIENFYQRQDGFIIVITEDDVQQVCKGANLVRMIIEKMEAISFQTGK